MHYAIINTLAATPNRKRSQIGLTYVIVHQSCMVEPPVVDDRGSVLARLIKLNLFQ